jgi:hypothetical protein
MQGACFIEFNWNGKEKYAKKNVKFNMSFSLVLHNILPTENNFLLHQLNLKEDNVCNSVPEVMLSEQDVCFWYVWPSAGDQPDQQTQYTGHLSERIEAVGPLRHEQAVPLWVGWKWYVSFWFMCTHMIKHLR